MLLTDEWLPTYWRLKRFELRVCDSWQSWLVRDVFFIVLGVCGNKILRTEWLGLRNSYLIIWRTVFLCQSLIVLSYRELQFPFGRCFRPKSLITLIRSRLLSDTIRSAICVSRVLVRTTCHSYILLRKLVGNSALFYSKVSTGYTHFQRKLATFRFFLSQCTSSQVHMGMAVVLYSTSYVAPASKWNREYCS
jgi:hypothetical protein